MHPILIALLSIFALILLLLCAVVIIPFRCRLRYKNGSLELHGNFLFFSARIFPRKEKRAMPTKKSAYRTAENKNAKASSSTKQKTPITKTIKLLIAILKIFHERFRRKLRLKIHTLTVSVAAEDAATCALLYGGVSQAMAYLLQVLDLYFVIKKEERDSIRVDADFLGSSSKIAVDITLTFNVLLLLRFYLRAGADIFKKTNSSSSQNTNSKTEDNTHVCKQPQ